MTNNHTPTPIADSSEAGRGAKQPIKCAACGKLYSDHAPEGEPVCDCAPQAVRRLKEETMGRPAALSAPVGEPYAYAKQIGSDIVRTHSLKHMMPEARAEYTIPLYTHQPAPAVGAEEVMRVCDDLIQGGHCGEDTSEKIARQRRNKIIHEVKAAILSLLSRQAGGEASVVYRNGVASDEKPKSD